MVVSFQIAEKVIFFKVTKIAIFSGKKSLNLFNVRHVDVALAP